MRGDRPAGQGVGREGHRLYRGEARAERRPGEDQDQSERKTLRVQDPQERSSFWTSSPRARRGRSSRGRSRSSIHRELTGFSRFKPFSGPPEKGFFGVFFKLVSHNSVTIGVAAEAIFVGLSIRSHRALSALSIKATLFLQWMFAKCSAFMMSHIRSIGLKSGE